MESKLRHRMQGCWVWRFLIECSKTISSMFTMLRLSSARYQRCISQEFPRCSSQGHVFLNCVSMLSLEASSIVQKSIFGQPFVECLVVLSAAALKAAER